MQREVDGVDLDVVGLFEFFNTPGTEIAPGSYEVGVYVEDNWFHFFHPGVISTSLRGEILLLTLV